MNHAAPTVRRSRIVGGLTAAGLLTSMLVGSVTSPASAAVSCDTSNVRSVAGTTGGGVTATQHSVTIGGVATDVCELTFKTAIDSGLFVTTTNTWTVPTGVTKVDIVVVAGGGGGGSADAQGGPAGGGGGGGGEVVVFPDLPVSGDITVQVGQGGLGGQTENSTGTDGVDSKFGDAQANGGKAGLSYDELPDGGDSGSGKRGGEFAEDLGSNYSAYGGGGGGDQADGGDAAVNVGGDGGAGFSALLGGLFGSETGSYGGGGGGGVGPLSGSGTLEGGTATEGGGDGATGSRNGQDGDFWTGGGGGGGATDGTGWGKGGAGADGIVRIRFVLPAIPPAPPAPNPPAPAPAPAADPTPTPTPTASVAVPDLSPTLPGSNPNIPAGGVPLGGSVFLVNGQPVPVTVKPDAPSTANATGLDIQGDGWNMRLVGRTANDRPLGLTPDGALILEQDRTAYTEGTGFQANSDVNLYLFSTPRFLGTVKTDASGSFRGSVPLPLDIAAGRHTLQSNGIAPDGAVRSLSLGVQVQEEVPAVVKRARTAKATVFFDAYSAKLSSSAKKSLRALAKGRAKATTRIVSVGYVQPSDTTANDESLSLDRAKAVASYLRSVGVKGAVVARGDGVAGESGAAGRKAVVTLTYRK